MNCPFFILVIVSLAMVGCGSKTAPSSETMSAEQSEALRNRLTNTNNGLEIRRWHVQEDADRLVGALVRYTEGSAADELAAERLRRNGFRFVRVRLDDLDAVLTDLGGANVDRNEWHGQIPEWRSLIERNVDRQGQAVAIDGRVRRFERGQMRLMIRSWTVQMEDGPATHLEVLPRHHQPQPKDLRTLLGEGGPTGEGFGNMAIDLRLEAGWAYVLVGESPNQRWPDERSGNTPSPTVATARPPKTGPLDVAGPETDAPLTMGEFMLGVHSPAARRTVIVFVPRVPQELFIPDQVEDESALQSASREPS